LLDDLEWLLAILRARCQMSGQLLRSGERPAPQISPYVASEPDRPVPARFADFVDGPSWYVDPSFGGCIED